LLTLIEAREKVCFFRVQVKELVEEGDFGRNSHEEFLCANGLDAEWGVGGESDAGGVARDRFDVGAFYDGTVTIPSLCSAAS
jgi:hypothetical protein